MKKFLVFSILFFSFFLLQSGLANADEIDESVIEVPNIPTYDQLTEEEQDYILNQGGYTIEQVNDYPLDIMKYLIQNEVELVGYEEGLYAFDENGEVLDNPFQPMAISNSQMTLTTYGNKLANDKAGKQKLYMYGSFKWLKHPKITLTDALAIGWPSSEGVWLNVNSTGSVQGYSAGYYDTSNGKRYLRTSKTSPDYTAANAGVGFNFNLRAGADSSDGYVGTHAYSNKLKNTFNIRVEYGHKTLAVTPSFTVFPGGVGVAVGSGVDRKDKLGVVSF